MGELPALAVPIACPDELAPRERLQVRGHVGLGHERLDPRPVELLADHRRRAQDGSFVVREPVEPCRQQRLDRFRHRERIQIARQDPPVLPTTKRAVVDEHRQQLFDEQGVAAGRLRDPGPEGIRRVGSPEEGVDQPGRVGVGQRKERDAQRVGGPAAPMRPRLEQLRASGAHDHDRHVARPGREVLEQVKHLRLRPVEVLDDPHQRTVGGEDRNEPAHGGQLLALRRLLRRQTDHPGDRSGGLVVLSEERRELPQRLGRRIAGRDVRGLSHGLGRRPEGDAVAVRQTAALQDERIVRDLSDELLEQARLADARRAGDRAQHRSMLARGSFEGREQQAHLPVPPDHRRTHPRPVGEVRPADDDEPGRVLRRPAPPPRSDRGSIGA